MAPHQNCRFPTERPTTIPAPAGHVGNASFCSDDVFDLGDKLRTLLRNTPTSIKVNPLALLTSRKKFVPGAVPAAGASNSGSKPAAGARDRSVNFAKKTSSPRFRGRIAVILLRRSDIAASDAEAAAMCQEMLESGLFYPVRREKNDIGLFSVRAMYELSTPHDDGTMLFEEDLFDDFDGVKSQRIADDPVEHDEPLRIEPRSASWRLGGRVERPVDDGPSSITARVFRRIVPKKENERLCRVSPRLAEIARVPIVTMDELSRR